MARTEYKCKHCETAFVADSSDHRKFCSYDCYWQNKRIDFIGGMTGKKHSEETKAKISKNRTGKMMGENHFAWKGNSSEDYLTRRRFRTTHQKKVFERDDYTCQICNQRGGSLQVHHKKEWKDYPEMRFELDNCQTLCMACHYYLTFKRKLTPGTVWGHNMCRRIES